MRKILFILIIIGFFGCKKKNEEVKAIYQISAFIRINNDVATEWKTNSTTAQLTIDSTGYRYVTLTATSVSRTITIEFVDHGSGNSISTGTRTVSEAYFMFNSGSNKTTSGYITVTANDASAQTFSGDFSFNAIDSKTGDKIQVSGGQLNSVPYSVLKK